jgi:dTDP-4-amino-4,6-dideoxygalactose transaminase
VLPSATVLTVPFLDLTPSAAERDRLLTACARVIASGRYIGGAEVERFEAAVAAYLGVSNAVACSSGSDALVIALHALGVGPGDEVIVPAFSFFSTVESIVRVGAVPRFVDIELETLAADPAAIEAAIGPRTRAILVVHIAGTPARIVELCAAAERRGVAVVEDAAQAFGSRVSGRALGSFGEVGCFSFQATKPLGALGDAGLVVCRDAEMVARCRRLTVHGATGRHRHAEIGGNYRMDALHAAMLSEKLATFEDALAARTRIAATYDEALSGLPNIATPHVPDGALSNRALYIVRVGQGQRDELSRFLAERGVETSVYYPRPLYSQEALLSRGLGLADGALPRVEQACREVLALPLYPSLRSEQVERVIESVRTFLGDQR